MCLACGAKATVIQNRFAILRAPCSDFILNERYQDSGAAGMFEFAICCVVAIAVVYSAFLWRMGRGADVLQELVAQSSSGIAFRRRPSRTRDRADGIVAGDVRWGWWRTASLERRYRMSMSGKGGVHATFLGAAADFFDRIAPGSVATPARDQSKLQFARTGSAVRADLRRSDRRRPPERDGSRCGAVGAARFRARTEYRIFAGAPNGGVWITNNGGTTWTPLTDKQASLSIGSLSLDPTDPTRKDHHRRHRRHR